MGIYHHEAFLGCTLIALFTTTSDPFTLISTWYSPTCLTLSLSLTPRNVTSSSEIETMDASRFSDKLCLICAATSATVTLPKSACDAAAVLDVSSSLDPESMTSFEKSNRGGKSLSSSSTDLSGYVVVSRSHCPFGTKDLPKPSLTPCIAVA